MNHNRIFVRIIKGKHKDKMGLIVKGPLNEKSLQYPEGWYIKIDEKAVAKELIQSMFDSRVHEMIPLYINISDTTYLVGKYMGELGTKEFQGGCCG